MSIKSKIPLYNDIVLPYHYLRSFLAANKFNYPASNMKVIAVTGTNGKTTTTNMIFQMLKSAGKKVAFMSTTNWGTYKKTFEETMHMTTASPRVLNERLAKFRDEGIEYLVLEISSHALSQNRTFGIPVDIAVLTNITHEHLDYHRTSTRYRAAKLKLFKPAKFSVLNADDPSVKLFAKNSKEYITYGIADGDFRAKSIHVTEKGTDYIIYDIKSNQSNAYRIRTSISGKFNVYNSLAAAAVGQHLNLTRKQIEQGIASLDAVPGRMNRVDAGQNFSVIVDFAHTPDAMQKVYDSLPADRGSVITLFGGAGRRDIPSRSMRGRIAAKNSNFVIITEDDSRDEPVDQIISQIASGAKKHIQDKSNLFMVPDRVAAIKKALSIAKKGDIVLLLGKGHEKTILRADGPHDWDDAKVAADILKSVK